MAIRVIRSLLVGFGLTILPITLGIASVLPRLTEILLWPGFSFAEEVWGGLHGYQPILLGLAANLVSYAAITFIAETMWKRIHQPE
jgi:hypothetical protein